MINPRIIGPPTVWSALLALLFVAVGGTVGYSQSLSADQQIALKTLRDKSIRTTEPEKVIVAMNDVAAPFLVQPLDKAEPIPVEILSALSDLLDFGRIRPGDPSFDIMAGQIEYPVWGVLVSLRQRAMPAMVKVIENEEMTSLKSKNALSIIRRIVGDDGAAIRFLLSEYEKAGSDQAKERILSATNKIEIIR